MVSRASGLKAVYRGKKYEDRFTQVYLLLWQDQASSHAFITSPLYQHFHSIALRLLDIALEEPSGEAVPICILQALILTTFHQLIHTLHRRAWISISTCVRVAYELRLHLIDPYAYDADEARYFENVEQWSVDEEHRRAWWAIWEFDVFASTIRSLPTAIDWSRNETLLPVSDEFWFNDKPAKSCRLAHEFQDRWKLLEKSGNRCAKAWLIVINSFMRDAQAMSNPYGSYGASRLNDSESWKRISAYRSKDQRTLDIRCNLAILANSLACCTFALPEELSYRESYLAFKAKQQNEIRSSRHIDSEKYAIHMMIQLARFMVHQFETFGCTSRGLNAGGQFLRDDLLPDKNAVRFTDKEAWDRYLNAADDIVAIVRNCSSHHVRYVNPFIASTIWLAAAAQVICKVFKLPTTGRSSTESNLELLQTNFNQYTQFWNTSGTLQHKMSTLEARLEDFRSTMMTRQKNAGYPTARRANNAPEEASRNDSGPAANNVDYEAIVQALPDLRQQDLYTNQPNLMSAALNDPTPLGLPCEAYGIFGVPGLSLDEYIAYDYD